MATIQPKILLQYNPVRTWPGTTQQGWTGAQSVPGQRSGALPVQAPTTTKYISKTGSDTNAGTIGAPYLTVDYTRTQLAGAFLYACILDSGTYQTSKIIWDKPGTWLYAANGQTPTITLGRGVGITGPGDGVIGAYGARLNHGSPANPVAPFLVAYVAKTGNNATAVKGNPALPYLTIQAAVTATVSGDYVRIQDSGTYVEDVTAGAKALTLQAATNCNPTLINVATGSGNSHIQNSGPFGLTITSMNIQETVNQTGRAVYSPGSVVTMNSCTVANGNQAIDSAGATVTNSYFFNAVNGIKSTGAVVVQNCLFTQTLGVTGRGIWLAGGLDVALNVSWSTFSNWCNGVDGSWSIVREYPNGAFTAGSTITNCIFDGFDRGIQFGLTLGVNPTGAGGSTVADCTFQNGKTGFVHLKTGGASAVRDCLFMNNSGSDCQAINSVNGAGYTVNYTNLVSIGNKNTCPSPLVGGGAFTNSLLGPSSSFMYGTIIYFQAINCTVVNATGAAFCTQGDGAAGVDRLIGGEVVFTALLSCIVNKCGMLFFADNAYNGNMPALNVVSSVYEGAVTYRNTPLPGYLPTYSNSFKGDAKLLSSYPGQENVGLDPASPAMGNGMTAGDDRGVDSPIFTVSAINVTISGIKFMSGMDVHTMGAQGGGQNLHSVARVNIGATGAKFVNCSFSQFGTYAIKSLSTSQVLNCDFMASDGVQVPVGNGVVLGANGNSIQNNTFVSLPGAAIANLQITNTINFNSTYACLYGHFDSPAALGTYNGNILATSSVLDYSGRGTHTYGCIGTASIQAILTNCVRLDPLYRDPDNGDLRLQTVAVPAGTTSFAYDSPAHNLVPGPKDAGAFLFTYGVISIAWTKFTLTYNPDQVMSSIPAVKLAEDFLPSGKWYSNAEAYPKRYLFTWGVNNPMPSTDLTSLRALFSSATGEVQVSFDNQVSWIPVRVERGSGFEFTDMDETYNVVKPQPLRQLAMVESA